eukprot:scaffold2836_cov95-Skeletonema_marinoi.AAC.3
MLCLCGIAEIDDIKLKECATCDLVRYCSDACQKEHISQHERACKKRADELHDELLFKQPESSHLGDCPICCLPMPLELSKSTMNQCCSKVVCNGCVHANQMREIEGKLENKCPFCRTPIPDTNDKGYKMMMKRIEANDPEVIRLWGAQQYRKGDYSSAFEYCAKAAELGNVDAHAELADLYINGRGVEKDEKKAMHHMEEAAISGHPYARYELGCLEDDIAIGNNIERAVKHWIIAANQGSDESIKALMDVYKGGFVSKENLAAALRAHQAAVDETKSPHREAAEEYRRKWSSVEPK